MNKEIMNNKGFSLVEMIVSVLITGILMIAVSTFLSASRTMFQKVDVSATLQEESISLERVISEFLMEAKEFNFEKNLSIKSANNDTVLWVKAKDNENDSIGALDKVYFFVHDKSEQKIRYCVGDSSMIAEGKIADGGIKFIKGLTGTGGCYKSGNEKFTVISTKIDSLDCTVTPRYDGNLVSLKCKYSYMGSEFTSTITAVTRNNSTIVEEEGG